MQKEDESPPVPNSPPELPLLPSGLETSSDDLEEEKGEPKRLRSTSITPGSEPLRARDPLEYDQFTGIRSAGPFAEAGDELMEKTVKCINLLKAPFRDQILTLVLWKTRGDVVVLVF